MKTIKISKIFRSTKDKAGKPLMTSDNRPYERLAIKGPVVLEDKIVDEYGDKWISGFGNKFNANWKEGDEVEINVEKVEKDGKTYLNFSMPNIWDEIRDIKRRLDLLEGGTAEEGETPEVSEEDLPF